jgi:enolase
MVVRIEHVHAVEIIDSYGRPALEVRVALQGGAKGSAWVASGANPPDELAWCLEEATRELGGVPFEALADVDAALRKLDGSVSELRPSAHAIRGASIAAARAMAVDEGVPLWSLLASPDAPPCLPVPYFTLVNGARRAGTSLSFEEFMIVPLGAPSMRAAVRTGTEIHGRLRGVLAELDLATRLGEDGGFAPEIDWPERVLELIAETIVAAGYPLGLGGVAIGLRVAASDFRRGDCYRMAGECLSSTEMVTRLEQMVTDFPIWSIEDGMAQDDWDGWAELTRRLGDRVQLVGGDVFATDPELIATAMARQVGNAVLIRVAQFGTVTETLEAMRACREGGYAQVVAHRGETSDAFIADLAVATGCGQLKAGAPIRAERVAKYNRLIEIEADHRLAYGV